jgi:membrane associated rhomboid family serine protease
MIIILAVLSALIAFLLVTPFVGRYFLRVVDRRRIMGSRASVEGSVMGISAPSRRDVCVVEFEFRLPDGRAYRIKQRSTGSAVRKLGLATGSGVRVRYLPEVPKQAFVHELVLAERGLPVGGFQTAESGAKLFYVSFKGPNKFNWLDQGDIAIVGGTIQFNALKHRMFWYPLWQRFDTTLSNILDTDAGGEAVQCTIGGTDGAPRKLVFLASSSAEAEKLFRILPAVKTTAFVESVTYQTTLSQLGPETTVTLTIIAVNVLAFLVTVAFGGGLVLSNPEVLVRFGTDYTPLTLGGQWWRLLTSIFLHFGLIHIFLNMSVLFVNGRLVERIYGPWRYLFIYLAAGALGNVTSLLWHPFVNGAGASGAIFGIIGASLAFFLKREPGVPPTVAKANLRSATFFVLYNLGFASTIHGIDNSAHIGGLATGFVLGLILSQPIDAAARAAAPWKKQWAIALSATALAAALLVFGFGTGKLAPRMAHGPNGSAIPRQALAPTLVELGGVRLGMNPDEVLAKKGAPLVRDESGWVYNTLDAAHDGVITVVFSRAALGKARSVVAVSFVGHDAASAPPELPYLNASTPADAIEIFSRPLKEQRDGGTDRIWFRNGVYVVAYDEKIVQYGIFNVERVK